MVYLDELEIKLISKASNREIAIYKSSCSEKYYFEYNPNDIESIICSAACSDPQSGLSTLTLLRNQKPPKGLYYFNNLTLLLAAAKIDLHGELKNINNYIKSHTFKGKYILSKLLKENFDAVSKESTNSIDRLAEKLYGNETIVIDDISCCLTSISDLYDFIILKDAVAKIMTQISLINNLDTYKKIVSINKGMVTRINCIYTIIIIIALLSVAPFITYNLYCNSEFFTALQSTYQIIITILSFLLESLFYFGIKKIRDFIKNKILSLLYKIIKIDYSEFSELLNKVNNIKK
ncbi:hypothetical protein J3U21_07895 [Gilliamella sp. B2776]|uniref:hypothetical protein n=1 Tax=unclassified Gilliamella TaxID=2685620 RepID=UPI0022698C68|nr:MULTISPECIES: hypothetical protein [unclassified Gilliamella]MCX8650298.1 hypothetical protein [Gilliamella sp. B2779]MCX8654159.1 hypothetical protein [Gilliamella sp. B2737]MCX8692071.1 hypothetical protein [Gilliamella sp. B2776]MCX8703229.1 hypothetical protein [Gilliamella sp. B2781]WDM19321.1 hypothetical protein J4T76_02955 [Gilliamella sp. B3022]